MGLQRRSSKGSVSRSVRLGFAAVVILLLVSAGVSNHNTRKLYDNASRVAQTHAIQAALTEVLSTMKDVETGQRGYVITGDKEFLEPYLSARSRIPGQIEHLHELFADSPGQRADLAALGKKIDLRLELSQKSNSLRAEKGFAAAQEFAATGQGKQAMDEVRALIAKMKDAEEQLLQTRTSQGNQSYYTAMIADLLVALLGVGLVGIAFEAVRRELAAHQRTAEALREQREWLQVILTSIGDAVIVTDAGGKITFLNPVAGSLTGWEQQAVGTNIAEVFRIINDATGLACESPVVKVLRDGTIAGLANHTLLIARDGKKIPIDDSGAPVRGRKGSIEGVVLVFRDITERKHAEDALRRSETGYRRLFETARDAILILDGDTGRIIDANPFSTELLGYPRAELLGKELWQIGHFVNREANQTALNHLREHGMVRYDELPLETKTGIRAKAECVGIVYDLDNKKLIHFNMHDITASVLAEEGLRAARDRFRSVVDHVIHGIITIDESGLVESINLAAESLFGYSAAEIVGQNVNRLMPEPYFGEHDSYLTNYLGTGEARIIGTGREVVGLRKDGSTFPMSLAVSTFPLGARRLFTGIVQDISERKRMEEELRQRIGELGDADRRKNEFLAMLAHELRNPIAPIHHAVQLLRKNCPADQETKWAHDVIERQVEHMRRMVDDLLDVSRITRGKINLQKEPIDVSAAVARAVEMVRPLIDARKQHLSVSLPPEMVRVEADLPRVAQVLANLLNNAAKYTEEGGSIWLSVELQGNEIVLSVRDTGIGIPADYLPHVFDLFSQEDSSLERTHGGLGIGLTLVRILVKMHGGSVQVFSAGTGKGSEFVVRLPILTVAIPVASTPPPSDKGDRVISTRRILVVDDNVDGAKTLSIVLRMAGHEVQTAHDGLTALETARQWPPDVVLLDIGMPHMNGLEVARRLRGELGLSKAMVVAMTGYGQDDDRQRSQEAGFNAHMVKPLDLDALQALLARPEAGPGVPGGPE